MPGDGVAAQEETFGVKAFGMELNATGQNLVWLVLALAVVGGFAYFLYMHHTTTQEADSRILDKLNEMVFVMSLPQDKREKLEIDMPDSLRAKIRHKRDE